MADTPDTPKPPIRRRAPRKTNTLKPATKTKRPANAKPAARTRTASKSETKPAATGKVEAIKARVAKAASGMNGKKWGSAAVAGGLAMVGAAATAALLSLRGSTPRKDEASGGGYNPDGQDASASFRPSIADENSVPDKG